MDFNLSDDRRMLSETLSRFLGDKYSIEKRHECAASDDGFSRDMWNEFAELGIVGALFSEENGGFGGGGEDINVVFEQLGRALVVEPFLPTLLAGSLISELGSDAQKEMLEGVISGEKLIAFAHGEPGSRYEIERVTAKAEKAGDGWQLNGNKSVVLGGGAADTLIISARTSGDEDSANGISLFVVDAGAAGLDVRSFGTVDGYPAAEIAMRNVSGELLGNEGEAFEAIEKAYGRATLAVCAEAMGAMDVAKDFTVEYMHQRKQFGVEIGKFQVLQHRMADVLIELEQMRSSIINASGHMNDDRVIRERMVSSAKHLAGRIGRQVAEEAIQIHGGNGMTWEYAVSHYAKRIIMIDHLFGDTDHHLERYISIGA
ncbi:MAG: pimeloyl-CoA dehydrogenase small subunit [Hyphomicrobiales bacterium]|nr:MAG: pimeloyl-CoA dehydrogenase small subunit [Hyphomicrobiales bacterium]